MFKSKMTLFSVAQLFSLVLALLLMTFSLLIGRSNFFLALNLDLGKIADIFFVGCSFAAEGWMWIPYFFIVFGWFKKDALLILWAILISTLLTQVPKIFIWDKVGRPMNSGIDPTQIHTIPGIELHLWNSFPSGHTATAFTMFLLTVYLFKTKRVLFLGALLAMACGYARIYLAQHFPLDVGGGIMVALITLWLSLMIRKKTTHA